jgi:hypothetical protein
MRDRNVRKLFAKLRRGGYPDRRERRLLAVVGFKRAKQAEKEAA